MTTNDTVSLRPAHGRDSRALGHLWTEVFVTAGLAPRAAAYSRGEVAEIAANSELFVAERGGAVVGAVALAPACSKLATDAADASEAQVCLLAVAPGARGAGIGEALLRHCAARAADDGLGALVLYTRPLQRAAHRLYERLDFERLAARDSAPDGHPRLAYRLALR